MRRRNLQTMGHDQTDLRERGAWAPFVGVALAVLTAGSLVVFSLVAQRTSLDGFSSRGVTAVAPSQGDPGSITLPAGNASGAAVRSDDGATGTALLTSSPPAPLSPPSVLDGSDDGAVASTDATVASGAAVDEASRPTGELSSKGDFLARFDGDALSLQFFQDGDLETATQDGRAAKAKGTDKPKKANKAGKKKDNAVADKTRGDARSARGGKGHGRPQGGRAQGSSHRSKGSNHAAASQRADRSRPAPASRPHREAKPKPKSSQEHSSANSKGRDKGRGRGHARD